MYLRFTSALVLPILSCCFGKANAEPCYRFALVRDLSDAFENSLKMNPPAIPIDVNLAKQQHEDYIHVLEDLIPNVVRLDSDPHHPDCNFIEDTAIIVGDTAVISRMGALERRGEEEAVEKVLEQLNGYKIVHIDAPGTMDGGDILFTGKHLLVGLSHRTNACTLHQLQQIFLGTVEVVGIPVVEGLHLKSVVSFFDGDTLVVADTVAGMRVKEEIDAATNCAYAFLVVPDSVASNVLRVGSALIVQEGFAASEAVLKAHCESKSITMIKLNMSELIKADGALTCGSLLIN